MTASHGSHRVRFANGAFASLELGNYASRFEYELELLTETGASGFLDQQRTLRSSSTRELSQRPPALGPKEVVALEWPSLHGGYDLSGYQGATDAFVLSIREGRPSPLSASRGVYEAIETTCQSVGATRYQ